MSLEAVTATDTLALARWENEGGRVSWPDSVASAHSPMENK